MGVLENFEGFLEDIGVEKASGTGISKSKQGSIGPWPLGLLLRVLVVLGVSMVTGTSRDGVFSEPDRILDLDLF